MRADKGNHNKTARRAATMRRRQETRLGKNVDIRRDDGYRHMAEGGRWNSTKEIRMSVTCDVILSWDATPQQLAGLGIALWRWCNRTSGNTGIYQYLDNQALADLIAGKHPVLSQPPLYSDRRGVHFLVRDEVSQDRKATLDSLRRELPAGGIEDVVVEGTSWNSVKSEGHTGPTLESTRNRAPVGRVLHSVVG
jgi:hypothetical protein